MNGRLLRDMTLAEVHQVGYAAGADGVPAPAPGFGPDARRRGAYMDGWREGRAVRARCQESSQ